MTIAFITLIILYGCNVIFTENDIKNTVHSFYIKPSVSLHIFVLITCLIDLFLFI